MHIGRCTGRLAVAAAAAAAISVGGVADAATSSISIAGTAQLKARGAAVVTHVVVQCPAGYQGQVSVGVSERVARNHVTSGSGFVSFTCTGSRQTLGVPATPFDRPFKIGVAFAQANLFAYDPQTGTSVSDNAYRTIQIT